MSILAEIARGWTAETVFATAFRFFYGKTVLTVLILWGALCPSPGKAEDAEEFYQLATVQNLGREIHGLLENPMRKHISTNPVVVLAQDHPMMNVQSADGLMSVAISASCLNEIALFAHAQALKRGKPAALKLFLDTYPKHAKLPALTPKQEEHKRSNFQQAVLGVMFLQMSAEMHADKAPNPERDARTASHILLNAGFGTEGLRELLENTAKMKSPPLWAPQKLKFDPAKICKILRHQETVFFAQTK